MSNEARTGTVTVTSSRPSNVRSRVLAYLPLLVYCYLLWRRLSLILCQIFRTSRLRDQLTIIALQPPQESIGKTCMPPGSSSSVHSLSHRPFISSQDSVKLAPQYNPAQHGLLLCATARSTNVLDAACPSRSPTTYSNCHRPASDRTGPPPRRSA